jgi:hypothetical protein
MTSTGFFVIFSSPKTTDSPTRAQKMRPYPPLGQESFKWKLKVLYGHLRMQVKLNKADGRTFNDFRVPIAAGQSLQ